MTAFGGLASLLPIFGRGTIRHRPHRFPVARRLRRKTKVGTHAPPSIGFRDVWLDFTGLYWVSLVFTGFCTGFSLGFTGLSWVSNGFYWLLPSFKVFLDEFTGFHWDTLG